jgi:Tol biopolymer transport system component
MLVYVRVAANPAGGDPRSVLRTIRADGSSPRFLLSAPTNIDSPDWSPDGHTIAFNDVRERLWVADADGSDRRRLGPRKLVGRQPRWSPNGSRVAFVDVDAAEVRVLDVRMGRVRTVFSPEEETFDVQYLDWGYAWSSDGRRLAVIRTAAVECVDDPTTDWCEQAQLSLVDVASGRSTLIYKGPLTSTAGGLDWLS